MIEKRQAKWLKKRKDDDLTRNDVEEFSGKKAEEFETLANLWLNEQMANLKRRNETIIKNQQIYNNVFEKVIDFHFFPFLSIRGVDFHFIPYDQTSLYRSIVEAQEDDSLEPQRYKEKVAEQFRKRDLKSSDRAKERAAHLALFFF